MQRDPLCGNIEITEALMKAKADIVLRTTPLGPLVSRHPGRNMASRQIQLEELPSSATRAYAQYVRTSQRGQVAGWYAFIGPFLRAPSDPANQFELTNLHLQHEDDNFRLTVAQHPALSHREIRNLGADRYRFLLDFGIQQSVRFPQLLLYVATAVAAWQGYQHWKDYPGEPYNPRGPWAWKAQRNSDDFDLAATLHFRNRQRTPLTLEHTLLLALKAGAYESGAKIRALVYPE